jgi:hypothetical protein
MIFLTRLATQLTVWTADEPTPMPSTPGFDGDPNMVTPGVIGFFLTFLVMLGAVLLIIDMVRRVRRVNYRSEIREKLEAELAAQSDVAGGSEPGEPREPAEKTKPR